MEQKTDTVAHALDTAAFLAKQYANLIQDIGIVVREHAMVHLDNVDSKILVSILERHTKVLTDTVKDIK